LYAASEVTGFAKTGGLADVAGSLPQALAERGLDCAVVMPLYRGCRLGKQPLQRTDHVFQVTMGERVIEGRIWRSTLPDSMLPVYLIEQPEYFERDDPATGRGIYQFTSVTGQKADYPDNCARYGFFARAIFEAMRLLDFWPDILHLNDWQTGLAAVYLREIYQSASRERERPEYARERPEYQRIRTVFTIHNLAYQGIFWHLDLPMLGLPWRLYNYDKLEFYGKLNFLKAGIVYADLLTTVSPTYAREIQTSLLGCGLHGVLMQRSGRLHGIVNGIDEGVWNPATDKLVPARYDVENIDGKARCKDALQRHFHLEVNPRTPLLGIVSRLASQKGFDLIEKIAPDLLRDGVQFAVLGDGEKIYRDMLIRLQASFPRQVGLCMEISEPVAHLIEAGADGFLMPSQYEPCGLNQLYSLKYGTIPIVRLTGGLADTVTDATPENVASGKATGFTFVPYAPSYFADAVRRCLQVYREQPEQWRQLQQSGMEQDWSWRRSAAEYERLYRSLLQEI
jgi:starch synthase